MKTASWFGSKVTGWVRGAGCETEQGSADSKEKAICPQQSPGTRSDEWEIQQEKGSKSPLQPLPGPQNTIFFHFLFPVLPEKPGPFLRHGLTESLEQAGRLRPPWPPGTKSNTKSNLVFRGVIGPSSEPSPPSLSSEENFTIRRPGWLSFLTA